MRNIINVATKAMNLKKNQIGSALKAARSAVKKAGGKRRIRTPRVIPLPKKIGEVLPFLVPLFAGLSALGSLAGGAAGITKAVNSANATKKQLLENIRHNKIMEAIALGKGLYLKPYKLDLAYICQKTRY